MKNRFSFLKKNNIDCSVYNKYNFHTGSVFDLQNREIENKLLPLLHYEDKNSMYHSVEARLPFLDYRVVMAALTLPIDLKINNGWTKYLLRKSGDKLLPNEILWRKHKLGFEAPANTWMSNRDEIHYQILNDKFLQSIISEIPPNISTNILWRLYSFALWNKNAQVTC